MGEISEYKGEKFDEIISSEIPYIVDFWAPWCGPCRMIAPILEEIANEMEESIKILKVNVDEYPDLAQRFGIMSIPTLLFFKKGEIKGKIIGAVPKKEILKKIKEL